jgi:hypothetical protein
MNSSDENNSRPERAKDNQRDMQGKSPSALRDGKRSEPEHQGRTDTRPVRIPREEAQANLPPDPDPDDPVSP